MLRRKRSEWLPFVEFTLAILSFCLPAALLTSCKTSRPTQAAVLPPRILTISHETPYVTLDPQKKNDSVTWSVIGNIYEPLVEFDNNMKIVGRLAERWENPNDLTWRFYLRRNVRFHNGRPFSSADVAYTIERGLQPEHMGTRPYMISVKQVRVIDPYTIDILTDRPNPVLLNRLTFIFILPQSPEMQSTVIKPIGTGPYMFEKEVLPGKNLLLKANPDYWRGKPAIDQVRYVNLDSEDETINAFLKGEIDVVRNFTETYTPRIESSARGTVVTHDGLGVTFLGFNLAGSQKNNVFLNRNVREAISLALDSADFVAKALDGRANVAYQLVSPVVFGYDPDLVPEHPDLNRARSLLAEAHLGKNFHTEVYGSDGQRVQKIADQIRVLNINVEPRTVAWSDLLDKATTHQISMYTLGWNCSTGDASDFLDSLIHTIDPKAGYGNFNMAGYSNPEADRLIELSGETLKTNERKLYLQQALALAAKDLPYIPLYSGFSHYAVAKELAWEPRRDARLYAADMSWKQAQ